MAATWTDEDKKKVIAEYKAAEPTAETSTEIIKDLADSTGFTANGIRAILVAAGVYVKKEPASGAKASAGKEGAAPRVSKETQINALRAAIEGAGAEANDEILEKLTGKAAAYFTEVIAAVTKGE